VAVLMRVIEAKVLKANPILRGKSRKLPTDFVYYVPLNLQGLLSIVRVILMTEEH
jgi:hypothetical protein